MALVVTRGPSSVDLYSQRLAPHLPVARIETNVYQRSARRFNVPPFSRASAERLACDAAFVRALRRHGGPVHLPNQHLGRYGRLSRMPFVITVHDLIRRLDAAGGAPLIHRPAPTDRALLALDYAGVRRARAVIAVSETTARDVVDVLGVPPERVTVVHNGIDHDLFRPVARRLFNFPYMLFVGSEQPRKNLTVLLRALKLIEREPAARDVRLVKVGGPGGAEAPFRARTMTAISDLRLERRVLFTGRLADGDLAAAYAGAACYVQPSLHEGFGLPPLEAMACGCPVVASTGGALPEVVGDAALSFDPRDERALARALLDALDAATAGELRARGLRRAARFSWERAARETRAVYAAVGALGRERQPA